MSLQRPLLLPLVPLYALGLRWKNDRFDRGLPPSKQLQRPVISIGSLSAGGAGKTPVVLMLAKLLFREGVQVDVLSRGYGRSNQDVEQVDVHGTAQRFGDEPLELAREGVSVYVGADRFAAGTLAESMGDAEVHLLDDGFQHRKLRRALDIVLLTQQDVDDRLLPAGDLRESLASLTRADVVVLREEEAGALRGLVSTLTPAEIWLIRRELLPAPMQMLRPLVFCGIARPSNFLSALATVGVQPAAVVLKPDHFGYASGDFDSIVAKAKLISADGFCTTAKDAVKIGPEAMGKLRTVGPLWVAELRVSLVDEDAALQRLRRALTQSQTLSDGA